LLKLPKIPKISKIKMELDIDKVKEQAVKLREKETFLLDMKETATKSFKEFQTQLDSLIPEGLSDKIDQVMAITENLQKKEDLKEKDKDQDKDKEVLSKILQELQKLTAIPKIKFIPPQLSFLSPSPDLKEFDGFWNPVIEGIKCDRHLQSSVIKKSRDK
jgi:hypothetical protein